MTETPFRMLDGEVVPLTDEEIAELMEQEAAMASAVFRPLISITPLQARKGLRAWGISRAQIDAFFDAIEDEGEREMARDAWEYATAIEKDHPFVAACAAFLGKTEAEVDQFFADASA
jgi:hypothetical protein